MIGFLSFDFMPEIAMLKYPIETSTTRITWRVGNNSSAFKNSALIVTERYSVIFFHSVVGIGYVISLRWFLRGGIRLSKRELVG